MVGLTGTRSGTYAYRADGMRVSKSVPGLTARYRYDGQMGFEDLETAGSTTTVTRYGLGARGIDFMERTVGSTVTAGFPLYDAHGNMVATLARSGTNSYAVNDRRSYDAWGVVRYSQSAGDPKQRYCANLGHRADDETLLVYMRARYYDAPSGRFISLDSARHGSNWYAYCANNPVSQADATGGFEASSEQIAGWLSQLVLTSMANAATKMYNLETLGMMMAFLASEGVTFLATGGTLFGATIAISGPEFLQKAIFCIDGLDAVQGTSPSPAGALSPAEIAVAETDAESLRLQLAIWTLDI